MIPGHIEELERQIDDTRHALDRTLDALQFQLSPRHQLAEAWRFTKNRTGRSLRAGANWAAANPTSAVLGAVAITGALYLVATRANRGR